MIFLCSPPLARESMERKESSHVNRRQSQSLPEVQGIFAEWSRVRQLLDSQVAMCSKCFNKSSRDPLLAAFPQNPNHVNCSTDMHLDFSTCGRVPIMEVI